MKKKTFGCFGIGCGGLVAIVFLSAAFEIMNSGLDESKATTADRPVTQLAKADEAEPTKSWTESISESLKAAREETERRQAQPRTEEEIEKELRRELVDLGEKEILAYEAIAGTARVLLTWRDGLVVRSEGYLFIVSLPGQAFGRFTTDNADRRNCRVAFGVTIHGDATRSEPLIDSVALRYVSIGGQTVFQRQPDTEVVGAVVPEEQQRQTKSKAEMRKEEAERDFQSREFRVWTSGAHTVRAKLKSARGDKATLVREDSGKEMTIAIDLLSEDDRIYIRKQSRR